MKKLISLITSGILAVMPAVQVQFSASAVDAETPATSEKTTVVDNAESFITPEITTATAMTEITTHTATTTTQQAESVTTTPLAIEEIRAFFEYDDTGDMPTVNIGEKLDLNNINLRVSARGIDAKGNQYKADADELNYTFSIGSGKHSGCYNYDTSEVDNATEAGIQYIYIELHPYTTDKFVLENSSSEELPNGEYEFTIRNEYHTVGVGDNDFYIPVKVIDPSAPPVTTQAPPTNGEIRANLDAYGYVSPVCINEELDLNKVNLSIGAWGFDSNDDWYEEDANKLNYNFSIGSGKHSDCYTYDISDVDTSKVGVYYIHVTAVPNVADKFVLENSVSKKLPNGTYKFVMQDKNFDIPVEVIDPSIPIATEPEYTGMIATTTTTIGTGQAHDCTTAPPAAGEIRAEFGYSDTKVTVNIGDELDLNKVNISVIACTDDLLYVRDLNYQFSIGSGKHSKCYTYDASEVDTSTAGIYYIYIKPISYVTDKFVIENSASSKIPNGEYEFVMQGGYHNDFGIPVEVIDPDNPITTTEATKPIYTGMTTTTISKANICDSTTHPTNITTEGIGTNSCTTTTTPTTTNTPVIKEIKGYMTQTKHRYYTALGEEFDVSRIEPVFALHIINEDGSELFCSADTPPFEKIKDLYTIDASKIDTSKLGRYYLKFESVGGITEKFDIKNAYYLPDGEYEIEMESQIYDIDIFVTNDTEHLNPPINTTQSGNGTNIVTTTTSQPYAPVTTQAPPTTAEEVRARFECNDLLTVNIGEEPDLDNINLSLNIWGFDSTGDWFEVRPYTLNYDFSIGSGRHSDCYTYDTSEVDTSKLGTYFVRFSTIPNIKEKFVLENSCSEKFPNGEYEFVTQDNEFYLPVEVIDPTIIDNFEFAENQSEYDYDCLIGLGDIKKLEYNAGEEFDLSTVTVNFYIPALSTEKDPFYVHIPVVDYTDIIGVDTSNVDTSVIGDFSVSFDYSNILNRVWDISANGKEFSIYPNGTMAEAYTVKVVDSSLPTTEVTTSITTTIPDITTANDYDSTTITTLSTVEAPVTKVTNEKGQLVDENGNVITSAVTTHQTTTSTTVSNIQTTANAIADYRTKLEYDNSPMKIGETRAIHVYIPETATASKTYISEVPENIDISYTDGSDTIYITALEAGDISFYVRESSCAFGDYVNLTITDKLFSEITTTTEENTSETTTTTTQPAEELPQTGYSDIYKWIVYFAAFITAAGTAVTICSRKRVK